MRVSIFRVFRIATLAVLAIFTITACSEDEKEPGGTTTSADKISATIDGQNWEANIGNIARTGGSVDLYSLMKDSMEIQLFLIEDTLGTFQLPSSAATINYVEGSVFWNNNISGEITITANNDDKISGTFHTTSTSAFNTDTVLIENGIFSWDSN